MKPEREIPQRELRNNVSAILREVEAGNAVRVTVRDRPVAELLPLSVSKERLRPTEVRRIVREVPLDAAFTADVQSASGATIDDL